MIILPRFMNDLKNKLLFSDNMNTVYQTNIKSSVTI